MKKISKLSSLLMTVVFLSLFVACSQRVTLNVIVDNPEIWHNHQNVKLFLLKPNDFLIIEQIRSSNSSYLAKSLYQANDSLSVLYRDYMLGEMTYNRTKSEAENENRKIAVEYGRNVKASIIRIQKIGNLWKFGANVSNDGPEVIDGVYLSLAYGNDRIASGYYLPVKLQPNEATVSDGITLNIGNDFPLMFRLSSHPGGINQLPGALDCRIDSVKSGFNIFQKHNADDLTWQRQTTDEIGLTIDTYPEQKSAELQKRIANPINRIIENNLNELAVQKFTLNTPDTLHITDLEVSQFVLVAYTAVTDSNQWLKTINLESEQLIKLIPSNCKEFFFNVRPEMLSIRPF